jgi:hypothetical protein
MEIKFEGWPKTPRLFKDPMVITEKIDGTNSAVGVVEGWQHSEGDLKDYLIWAEVDGKPYTVYAQSRNRLIAPASVSGVKGSDNYAFAEWVFANHHELARVLGVGLHYGEWWGVGIGRNYGLAERRFSLFNTSRWKHLADPEARAAINPPAPLTVVPVLAVNTIDTELVHHVMRTLLIHGSYAAPGFMDPEGICVFLPSGQQVYKVTFDGDKPKWLTKQDMELMA